MSKEIVFNFLDAHRKRDAESIKDLCNEGVEVRGSGWEIKGVDHYVESQINIWKELPSQELAVEGVIADGDMVAVQWIDRSDHPSDGGLKRVITSGCSIFTVTGKQIYKIAQYDDTLDVVRQLQD